jgi:alpha-mannosidase
MTSKPTPAIEEILLLHHSHLDVGYTHSQPILWELQNEFITQAIDWLEDTASLPEGSRPKWTCEVTEPVRRWLRRAPATDIERFKKLHQQGRIGLGAMRWNTAALVDRAGLHRLLDGKAELEQLLGAPIRVAAQHDVDGVPWPIADELIDAGVDLFVMAINPHLGRAVGPRPGMFLWEAPSGRTLRVFNGNHYTMFDQLLLAWDNSVDRMVEGWATVTSRLEDIGYDLDFVYLTTTASPILWDNAPPNPFMPDLIERWNEAKRGPRIRYVSFDDLRERALAADDNQLPVLRGDWTDYWSFGYGSAPIATAVNQRAKSLGRAAQTLFPADDASTLRSANDKGDLYDEHTWSYFDPSPEHPQAQTIELLKQSNAYEAHELAAFAVMDGLEKIALNPVADKNIKGVLLANPGATSLTVRPELPAAWFESTEPSTERTYRASRMFYDNRSWASQYPGTNSISFGPVELAPYSWRSIPLDELPEATEPVAVVHEIEAINFDRRELNFAPVLKRERRIGRIESPFHILRYDVNSGRILSLVDREQGRELLNTTSGLDLFSFVRERTDALIDGSRYAFYERDLDKEKFDESCWQDWKPVRERATRVIESSVIVEARRVTFERRLEGHGMIHLVQRVSLLADDPVIHLEVEMELIPSSSAQSIYLAFPLALKSGWKAMFDTAGTTVGLDVDQLEGSCRNWVTTESMAAMWDDDGGVALLTPDAPMVQFGDYHFGPPLDTVPRPENPLLLAWPVNNYWDTNFPLTQTGRFTLRYGLLSAKNMDAEVLRQHAERFRQPSLIWPITSGGRPGGEGKLRDPRT